MSERSGVPPDNATVMVPFERAIPEGSVPLTDIPKGSVARMKTRNSEYEIAVIDPDRRIAAIRGGRELPEARLCFLQEDWICPGRRFRASLSSNPKFPTGGMLETSPVRQPGERPGEEAIDVKPDPVRWDWLVKEANARE